MGSFSARAVVGTSYYFNRDNVITNYAGASQGDGTLTTTSDVPTPGFHRLMKSGAIINSPFLSVKETHVVTDASRTNTAPPPYVTGQNWKVSWNRTAIGFDKRAIDLDYTSAITSACTQALANVDQPTAQSGVFLLQFQQLLNTLKAPLAGISQAISYGAKGKKSQSVGALSSQSLSIQYGILPAMKDIEDILKAFQKESHVRKTARGQASVNASLNWTRPFSTADATGTVTGSGTRVVTVRAGTLYETAFDYGFSNFGLSVSNIPSIAWEMIPYSFVVDWFLNLGTLIEALSPTIGTNRLADWYTVRDVVTRHESLALTAAIPTSNTISGGGDTATSVIETRSRAPTNLGANIGLVFNPRVNPANILASVSLITQKLTTGSTGFALRNAWYGRGRHTS